MRVDLDRLEHDIGMEANFTMEDRVLSAIAELRYRREMDKRECPFNCICVGSADDCPVKALEAME